MQSNNVMPSTDTASQITQWVLQARSGDRLAFHQLVDRFQPEIYRMIYYRLRSSMDAEDLTQDVFLKAFKHLGRLKSPELFRSWLYRIAVNRMNDHFRKKQLKALVGFTSMDDEDFHESEQLSSPPQAPGEIARKDFWDQVGQALKSLSKMEKEVFLLRFFDQLTIKEMTAALNKNESTVKTHLYRALQKVKERFAGLERIMEGL